MNRSTPGFPVVHYLSEFVQTHVHWVSDAIQPFHPLTPPAPFAPSLSQPQSFPLSRLFTSGGQSIGASVSASVLPDIQGWFPSAFNIHCYVCLDYISECPTWSCILGAGLQAGMGGRLVNPSEQMRYLLIVVNALKELNRMPRKRVPVRMVWKTLREMRIIKLKLRDGKKPAMLRAGEKAFPVEGTASVSTRLLRRKTVWACPGNRGRPARPVCVMKGTEGFERKLGGVCNPDHTGPCRE